MSIQSRLVAAETNPAPSYPYLARYEHQGLSEPSPVPSNKRFVVLFLEGSRGIVVQASSDAKWQVGYECDVWCRECFEPFHGEVALRNA